MSQVMSSSFFSWAIPGQKLEITRTEPNTSIVDTTYHLCIYERNVQVSSQCFVRVDILKERHMFVSEKFFFFFNKKI